MANIYLAMLGFGDDPVLRGECCDTGDNQIYSYRDAVRHPPKDRFRHGNAGSPYVVCLQCSPRSLLPLDQVTPDGHAGWVAFLDLLV